MLWQKGEKIEAEFVSLKKKCPCQVCFCQKLITGPKQNRERAEPSGEKRITGCEYEPVNV